MEMKKESTCTHTHQDHEHSHNHSHANHNHNHSHGNQAIYLYFIGLISYLAALFVPMPTLLEVSLMIFSMVTAGYHVILEGFGETITDSISQRKFLPNVHILMTLAALGASLIGDFDEGALLILIFAGAHFLEEYAEGKSKREITKLLKMNPTEARLIQSTGEIKVVSASSLKIGDHLQVLPGDQVATDGIILTGTTVIDESSITGESMPQEKRTGDTVFGSTINGSNPFTMEVTKNNEDTVFAKILQLVNQSQGNLSQTATTIKRLEPYYVTVVLLLVPVFILVGVLVMNWSWNTSFYRGMVLLISASPCALAASAIPATLAGISCLAKKGILFKGGNYLSNLASIKAVAFDKTGTLTEGKPVVTDFEFQNEDAQARWIDVIVAMEKEANHPLAKAILDRFGQSTAATVTVTNEIGKGLIATHQDHSYQLGKRELFPTIPETLDIKSKALSAEGKTVIFFSEDHHVVGLLALLDVPNPAAKEVIQYLNQQSIHTVMLTGDQKATGEAIAKDLEIAAVQANILPENKAEAIAALQHDVGTTVMLGDGINDAPALVTADIGVAMGDGTDVAIDVADAVIMKNDLRKFSFAHKTSKKLNRIVWQNIAFAMLIVAVLIVLNIMGKMDIGLGVIVHEGSTLLVILNGLRMLIPTKE